MKLKAMKPPARILFFALVALILVTLFPPWLYYTKPSGHLMEKSAGFACLLAPPVGLDDRECGQDHASILKQP
jgi:hypothetical protein